MSAPRMLTLAALLFGLLVGLVAPDAMAQTKDEAVAQFNDAAKLAKNGELAKAVEIWISVYEALPDKYRPAVQLNLGLAYKKLERYPDAWYYLSRYRISGPHNEKAEGWMDEVEAKLLGEFRRVTITCIPFGTMVAVSTDEGAPIHECPLTWWFEPGEHQIRLSKPGFKAAVKPISVPDKKGEVRLSVTLEEETDGVLAILGSEMGAKVYVSGKEVGKIPYKARMKSGKYHIKVTLSELPAWEDEVEVLAGRTTTREPRIKRPEVPVKKPLVDDPGTERKPPAARNQWWKWTLLGGGVAMVATGAALHGIAARDNNDLKKKYPDGVAGDPAPVENQQRYNSEFDSSVLPKAVAGYVLYGVGAAAATAGLVTLIIDMTSAPADTEVMTTRIRPMALPDGGGVTLGLTF
ncbi:MAG: PEGA domain-containing protein [Pseudomonadota bacterium]